MFLPVCKTSLSKVWKLLQGWIWDQGRVVNCKGIFLAFFGVRLEEVKEQSLEYD